MNRARTRVGFFATLLSLIVMFALASACGDDASSGKGLSNGKSGASGKTNNEAGNGFEPGEGGAPGSPANPDGGKATSGTSGTSEMSGSSGSSGTSGSSGDPTGDGGQGGEQAEKPKCVKLRQLRGYSVNPSAVAQLFTVENCADGLPVSGLDEDDFDIVEDNETTLSSEAGKNFQTSKGLRVYVSFVLDMSSSTHDSLPQLIDGAKAFVDELLVKRQLKNVLIGITLFDGSPNVDEWLLPISDAVRIKAKLDALTGYTPPDPSSTNLYGAAIAAVKNLQERQIKVMQGNDNGVVTVGYAVLFTDGADTAGRTTKDAAITALANARYADTTSVQVQATVSTYAVPLAGPDYTPGSLQTLLTRAAGPSGACTNTCLYANSAGCDDGGPGAATARCTLGTDCNDCGVRQTGEPAAPLEGVDGSRFVFQADNAAALKQRFSDLAGAITRQLEGTYLLAYCSPKRTGQHTVSLNVKKSYSAQATGYTFPLNAQNFGPGCSTDYFKTVCNDKQCGGFNCGACNEETDVCNAQTDTCQSACIKANSCSGQTITNVFGYGQVCEPAPHVKSCQASCTDTWTDALNCGDCAVKCGIGASCKTGQCACPTAGATSCPAGCFDLKTDANNCGTCGNYCPAGIACVGGACQCATGLTGCFGVCLDTKTSNTSCGKCGNACPVGVSACTDGACLCTNSALTACGNACVNTQTDAKNCGTCGHTCTAAETCTAGSCAGCFDVALPSTASITYNGTANGMRTSLGCADKASGTVGLQWTPLTTGNYSVKLTAGSVDAQLTADVAPTCTTLNTCIYSTTAKATTVAGKAGVPLIFFVSDATGVNSAYTLTIAPL